MNTTGSQSVFNKFSSNKYVSSTNEFLESNSLVAKIAFLFLVLFVFVILLRIGIMIIGYMVSPSNNPKLINGMVDASKFFVIPQDPLTANSITINRSVNATDGIEFTWCVWVFIDNLNENQGKYKCVFYKGNDFSSNPNPSSDMPIQQGLNFPNNAPGLYITPNTNNLVIFMNTFNVINEEILVEDIPIHKWVNIIIRCQNSLLDVYVNGTITKSHQLQGVPKQNYGDVYVAPNGGFAGYISNLWYYNYALGTKAIGDIVAKGPNTKMVNSDSSALSMKNPNYLSLRWFFSNV
jgi:hypothetical protein